MGKRKRFGDGFAPVETLLVLVIIAIIGFVAWFVVHAKHNTDKTLSTAGSSQNGSAKTGNGTDNQSLQDDLSGINGADDQTTKDLNASNSGLNDSSTFTTLP